MNETCIFECCKASYFKFLNAVVVNKWYSSTKAPSDDRLSQTAVYSSASLSMKSKKGKKKNILVCRFLPFYCIILVCTFSIIYNPLLCIWLLHTFKMYIWHYLEGAPPLWQHVQQTETYIAQQSYTWWQEKRHAHSETIYNPEQMITVFKQLPHCDYINSLLYTVDPELPLMFLSCCDTTEAEAAFKWPRCPPRPTIYSYCATGQICPVVEEDEGVLLR